MNLPLISQDPAKAREQLEAYQECRASDEEVRAAAAALKVLAKGMSLVDVNRAIVDGGMDDDGFPRLAIARADRFQVSVEKRWESFCFSTSRPGRKIGVNMEIRIPFPVHSYHHALGYALVPFVPPTVCTARSTLKHRLILWEVEEGWAKKPLMAEPDVDPFLLEVVIWPLCAVIGQWELTELEQAITGGRRER